MFVYEYSISCMNTAIEVEKIIGALILSVYTSRTTGVDKKDR